jgi:hypothetical protein
LFPEAVSPNIQSSRVEAHPRRRAVSAQPTDVRFERPQLLLLFREVMAVPRRDVAFEAPRIPTGATPARTVTTKAAKPFGDRIAVASRASRNSASCRTRNTLDPTDRTGQDNGERREPGASDHFCVARTISLPFIARWPVPQYSEQVMSNVPARSATNSTVTASLTFVINAFARTL